jgi:asparagine synthase (glutamine-hydrolysing)
MPGLSFIWNPKHALAKEYNRIERSLDSVIHMPNYSKKVVVRSEQFVLACTGYPEYPVEVLDLPDYTVVVEGRLYDLPDGDLANEIGNMTSLVFGKGSECDRRRLTTWLQNTDGEFIIFIRAKQTNDIAIFNDLLGRLPCYYFKQGRAMILSRELRFVAKMLGRCEYDKMGVAQFMLFGYPLGSRTILKNVQRLPPATVICINGTTCEMSLESLHTFNLDSKQHAHRTVEENASELVERFRKSCRRRANKIGTNLVALSGGLDSRTVAAGLQKEEIPFLGATYLKHSRSGSADMTNAALLAEFCDWRWEAYLLDPPRGRHFLRLLRIKNGLNYLGMSFILPFFEAIREKHCGRITWFTGDGGDKVLPDLRPYRRFGCLEELADFILRVHQRSSLKTVAALTQLDRSEIRKELATRLATYPEKDLTQKYVHFMIYERGMKWLFEGEDRNRFYFWSTAPFYSIRFFTYAMNCPDNQKSYYSLYRHFLRKLSRQSAEIADANVGLPPVSRLYGLARVVRDLLGYWLPPSLKAKLQGDNPYGPQSAIVSCLRDQLNCEALRVHLSIAALKKIVDNCRNHSKYELENVFSVTSLIEDLDRGHSSIERYDDTCFL